MNRPTYGMSDDMPQRQVWILATQRRHVVMRADSIWKKDNHKARWAIWERACDMAKSSKDGKVRVILDVDSVRFRTEFPIMPKRMDTME